LGFDPEYDSNSQILSDVGFFTREQITSMPRVYPEVLKGSPWDVLENGGSATLCWAFRQSPGFDLDEK